MRNRLRSGWLVLQTAFRADPVRTIGAVVLEGGGQAGRILIGVWLKLVTDGVITRDARSVVDRRGRLGARPPPCSRRPAASASACG